MTNVGLIIKQTVKTLGTSLSRESPTILTAISVSGLFTTVFLAVKATPKALALMDDKRLYEDEDLTNLEIAKIIWQCYAPAILTGAITIGCIISANSINLRRNAALASVYALTESALKEYQQKVVDTLGRNKEEKIRDSIAQDKLLRDPLEDKQVILTGKGETMFYDSLSGRYFKNDMENIRKVQNDFNAALLTENYKPLNDFYNEIGLMDTELGKSLGWDVNYGMLDIRFSAKIATNGVPCIVLEYKVEPRRI